MPDPVLDVDMFISYGQVVLRDRDHDLLGDPPTDEEIDAMLRDGVRQGPGERGALVLTTESEISAPMRVFLLAGRPDPEVSGPREHVVEASVDVPSGQLVLEDLLQCAVHPVTIAPGTYRVRIHTRDLGRIRPDQSDHSETYELTLWPEAFAPPVVLVRCADEPGGARPAADGPQ